MDLHPGRLILFVGFLTQLLLLLGITAILSLCLAHLHRLLPLGFLRRWRLAVPLLLSSLLALLIGLVWLHPVCQDQGLVVRIEQGELGWLVAGHELSLIQGLDHQTGVLLLSYQTGCGVCCPVRDLAAPGSSLHPASSLRRLVRSRAQQLFATPSHLRLRAGSILRPRGLSTPRQ